MRRLNQHFFTEDQVKGLEGARIPLFNLLQTSLSEFDTQYKGNSYWVSVKFSRPLESGKTVRKAIHKSLTNFLSNPASLPFNIKVTERIYFHVSPSKAVEGRVFRFAGGIDRESGGFVLFEFKRNLENCMKEKSAKINDHHSRYKSWWLVLVDQIAYGFDEDEKKEIKSMVKADSGWDKVIVLYSYGKNILEI